MLGSFGFGRCGCCLGKRDVLVTLAMTGTIGPGFSTNYQSNTCTPLQNAKAALVRLGVPEAIRTNVDAPWVAEWTTPTFESGWILLYDSGDVDELVYSRVDRGGDDDIEIVATFVPWEGEYDGCLSSWDGTNEVVYRLKAWEVSKTGDEPHVNFSMEQAEEGGDWELIDGDEETTYTLDHLPVSSGCGIEPQCSYVLRWVDRFATGWSFNISWDAGHSLVSGNPSCGTGERFCDDFDHTVQFCWADTVANGNTFYPAGSSFDGLCVDPAFGKLCRIELGGTDYLISTVFYTGRPGDFTVAGGPPALCTDVCVWGGGIRRPVLQYTILDAPLGCPLETPMGTLAFESCNFHPTDGVDHSYAACFDEGCSGGECWYFIAGTCTETAGDCEDCPA